MNVIDQQREATKPTDNEVLLARTLCGPSATSHDLHYCIRTMRQHDAGYLAWPTWPMRAVASSGSDGLRPMTTIRSDDGP